MTLEKIEGPVPFLLNLGQPEQVIGWAQLYRKEDGNVQMVVDMVPDATKLVDHFVEIADLKGIGFAGIMRHPSPNVVKPKGAICKCGHDLGDHPPDPQRPFAWPCRACDCREFDQVETS